LKALERLRKPGSTLDLCVDAPGPGPLTLQDTICADSTLDNPPKVRPRALGESCSELFSILQKTGQAYFKLPSSHGGSYQCSAGRTPGTGGLDDLVISRASVLQARTEVQATDLSHAMAANPLNVYSGPDSLRKYFDPDCQPPLPLVEIPDVLNPFRKDGVRIYAKMMTMLPAHNVKALPGQHHTMQILHLSDGWQLWDFCPIA